MAKYTSGRQKNLKVGISSYSENLTSLEVIGKVGIGTTNPTTKLQVDGSVTLGAVSTDLISIPGRIASNFYPNGDGVYDIGRPTEIGSGANRWRNANFLGKGTFDGGVDAHDLELGVGSANLIYSTSGNLELNSQSGTTNIDDNVTISGNTGIGTVNPTSKLHVVGNVLIVGITTLGITSTTNLTSQQLNVSGITTLGITSTTNLTSQQLNVSGITTLGVTSATNLTSQQLNVSGVSTFAGITTYTASLFGTTASFSGVVTSLSFSGNASSASYATNAGYSTSSGIATYATNAGTSTSVIGGIASVTQLSVSGITTFDNNVYVPSSSVGIGTTNPLQRLQVGTANTLGINTNGTVFVVTSNADVGIGTTNPTSKLHVIGDGRFTGVVTATSFSGTLSGYASSAGIATYATSSGIATYATNAGIATYASSAGIATYATSSGIATYATSSGIATYATSSGIATYATNAGIATYATSSGIATYATIAGYSTSSGIATYATSSGIATYATSSGIATNLKGGLAGNIVYQSAPDVTVFLVNGGSGTILQSNGVGNAPTWVSAAPAGAVTGLVVRDSNNTIIGSSGSVTQLTFGSGLSVTGTTGAAGIATITLSSNIVGTSLSISGITTVGFITATNLYVSGISTFGTFQISSGIVTATSGIITYYGDGSKLSNIISGVSISTNTTNQAQYLTYVTGTGSTTGFGITTTGLVFNPSTGNMVVSGTVTANSDEKLKTNIQTIPNALEKVLSLRGVEYDRIDTLEHQIGLIAQEVEKIVPEVVYPKQPAPNYETKSVAYANLIGLLIEAIKEQNVRIEELERRLGGM